MPPHAAAAALLLVLGAGCSGPGDAAASGWRTATPPRIASGIDSISMLQVTEGVFKNVYDKKKPVLIRGAVRDWPAFQTWSKEYLEELFANVTVYAKTESRLRSDVPTDATVSVNKFYYEDLADMKNESRPMKWGEFVSSEMLPQCSSSQTTSCHKENPSYIFTGIDILLDANFTFLRNSSQDLRTAFKAMSPEDRAAALVAATSPEERARAVSAMIGDDMAATLAVLSPEQKALPVANFPPGDTSTGTNRARMMDFARRHFGLASLYGEDGPFAHWASTVEAEATVELFLSAGANGSGLGPHQHTAAWCGMLHGTKVWSIHPTSQQMPRDTTLRVIQERGDLIYIPNGWYHAVSNVGDVIAISALDFSQSHEPISQEAEEPVIGTAIGPAEPGFFDMEDDDIVNDAEEL